MAEEKQKTEFKDIDLNNLDLSAESSEELELNPDGDAFAAPPPPPEFDENGKVIKWRVKLEHSTGEQGKYKLGTTKDGDEYIKVGITATIVDPGNDYDGRMFFDGFISTLVQKTTGTCRMAGILKALGVKFKARTTKEQLAKLFQDTINGSPECVVKIKWSAYSPESKDGKGADVLVGMRHWAQKGKDGKPTGRYISKQTYEKTGEELEAQAKIQEYLPISALD